MRVLVGEKRLKFFDASRCNRPMDERDGLYQIQDTTIFGTKIPIILPDRCCFLLQIPR